MQQSRKKSKVIGSVSYSDSAAGILFHSTKLTSLTFGGNHAHITGSGKSGKAKLSFTLDVDDNGNTGTFDVFSIHFSNGYSASGNLTSGNITIH